MLHKGGGKQMVTTTYEEEVADRRDGYRIGPAYREPHNLSVEELAADKVEDLLETSPRDGGIEPVEYLHDVQKLLDHTFAVRPDHAAAIDNHLVTAEHRYFHEDDDLTRRDQYGHPVNKYTQKAQQQHGIREGGKTAAATSPVAALTAAATGQGWTTLLWMIWGSFAGGGFLADRLARHNFDQHIREQFHKTRQRLQDHIIPP